MRFELKLLTFLFLTIWLIPGIAEDKQSGKLTLREAGSAQLGERIGDVVVGSRQLAVVQLPNTAEHLFEALLCLLITSTR